MKILLVGFQPKRDISYPHLRQVADHLASLGGEYCLFRERGYFLGDPIAWRRWPREIAKAGHTLLTTCVDMVRLTVARARGHRDIVIAVDNFSYLVAARLFRNVVLWSHDFLTRDEPRSESHIQRFISSQVAGALRRHRKLVIQDQDRLDLFRKTYLGDAGTDDIDTFLLPVSLLPLVDCPEPPCGTPPILMQIGGISAGRSRSDELLEDFQANRHAYSLAFHGFVAPEMAGLIVASAVLPWVSSLPLAADAVHKVVEKCDIGFIAYNSTNQNFFHVARASGQLAEFLRCSRPVIALGDSTLGPMLEAEKIGVCIHRIDQLGDAVRHVRAHHERYSANCRRVFAETYDLSKHLPGLTAWLSRLARS